MEYPGNLFVVAAPSGAGKSSLVKALLELDSHLAVSVSHTTRAPRGQEQRRPRVLVHRRSRRSAPWSSAATSSNGPQVHGNLYGTCAQGHRGAPGRGDDVVLEIDWQGALQIKQLFPNAVLIFILPPSWDELRQRLQRRGEDQPEVIASAWPTPATRWRRPATSTSL